LLTKQGLKNQQNNYNMLLSNEKWKAVWAIILCACLGQTSFGQQTWERAYGDSTRYEVGNVVEQTIDGGYIVGGYKQGVGVSSMYLVKLNAVGDTLWTKNHGENRSYQGIRDLQQTADGGYILASSRLVGSGVLVKNVYLVKTDVSGDTIWTKQHGNTWTSYDALSIEQTTDGGYILTGTMDQTMYLMKTDVNGDSLWTKTYAGLGGEGYVVHQTSDGGYIIGGRYAPNNIPSYGLIKTDNQGDTLWTYNAPLATLTHLGGVKDVQQTADGGYIAVGDQEDNAGNLNYGIMFKTDSVGALEWGGLDTMPGGTPLLYYKGVVTTQDGGYIYTGQIVRSFLVNGVIDHRKSVLLRKRDANGNVLWEREHSGGLIGNSIQETATGGVVVAGRRMNYFTGFQDMYVFLADSLGNYRGNNIEGNIYQDLDLSCDQTSGDIGLGGIVVQASLNGPSSFDYYTVTDPFGHYTIPCQSGTYTVSIPNLHPYYNLSCPQNTGVITAQAYDTVDFPLEVLAFCPIMGVDVSAPTLREIVSSYYTVQYYNTGTDTADNVVLTVDMDSFLNILSFSTTPTSQSGNTYIFNLGTVGVGESGLISIRVQVDTSAILGQTHCVEASITPDSLCLPSVWTGMLLDVNGTCQNDSIFFNIQNTSTSALPTPRMYWVFEDNIIMRTGTVNVPNGATSVVSVPALPRKFYRIEVEQESGIPWTISDPIVSAFVEGCVPDGNGDFNIGFPTQFLNGHAPTFRAISCKQNTGSFDPNNKEAQPVGYDAAHYINPNQYIDYQINFQNTGTDTAFFVTLIDSLSTHLDPGSIQLTSASHPYTWTLKGNGILEVKFDYIMLPDSNVNEAASHGFAKFRIQQKANNPVGTILNNFADIYFDLNAPVRTNTTYHEIGMDFYILTIVPLKEAPELKVKAFPNPFTSATTIQVEGEEYDNLTLMVYDIMGRQVAVLSEDNTSQIELSRNNLKTGVYVFKLLGNDQPISAGKIIAQ
jgi:uncharacterized repeat protein (TIGR01451 family)